MKRKQFKKKYLYHKKDFMTAHESFYYNIFKDLEFELNVIVQPQIPLISIVNRKKDYDSEYPYELNRIIDFGIFSRDYKELILLIEIGDNSHKNRKRTIRDKSVKSICESVGITIITFRPEKFVNENEAREHLRKQIISYYDIDKEGTMFENV